MMYFESNEKRNNYIKARINLLRDAAGLINAVKPVVISFNGKTYNCRFDEAIRAACDNKEMWLSVSNNSGHLHIECGRLGNYSNCITLLSGYGCISSEFIRDQTDKERIIFDGKKIISDKMIFLLNERREIILKEAYEIETKLNNIQFLLDQLAGIKKAYKGLVQGLPSVITDAYNINKWAL